MVQVIWRLSIFGYEYKIKNKVQDGRSLINDPGYGETNNIRWNLILSNLEYGYDLLKRRKDIW